MNTNRRHTWAVWVPGPSLLGMPTKELVTAADCYVNMGVLEFYGGVIPSPDDKLLIDSFPPGTWVRCKLEPSEESEEIGGVVAATVIEAFGRRSG